MATSEEPVVRNETIIPLIRVCRKIDGCDTNQLATFLQQLPRLFDDNADSQCLKQLLRRAFCNDHASFSPELFQALLDALPNEKGLSVDDSITNSHPILHLADAEETQSSSSTPSFLQLPEDIKISIFNYLHANDIFSVQKVCRCLTVAARNPNSCFHLEYSLEKALHYWHACFSRVKHLEIKYVYESSRFNCPLFPAFFRSVTHLWLRTSHLIQKPFENLQSLSLNGNATLDHNWMETLVLCRDLRSLDLGLVSVDPELVDTFAFPPGCFRNLTDITLRSVLVATFPRLVAALLTTGSDKDLALEACGGPSAISNSHCALFGEGTKHLLLNIKAIGIECTDSVYCKSLMSNIASAINSMKPSPAFDIDISIQWDDLETIVQQQTVVKDLKTILQCSKKSELCLEYVSDGSEDRVLDELMCPSAQKVMHQFNEVFFEFLSDVLKIPDDDHYVERLYGRLLGDITDEEFTHETESFARMIMRKYDRWLNWMLQDKSSLREQMREVQLKRIDIEWDLHFEHSYWLKKKYVLISNAYEDCHINQTTERLMKAMQKFFLNKLQHKLDICDIELDMSEFTLSVVMGKMWH